MFKKIVLVLALTGLSMPVFAQAEEAKPRSTSDDDIARLMAVIQEERKERQALEELVLRLSMEIESLRNDLADKSQQTAPRVRAEPKRTEPRKADAPRAEPKKPEARKADAPRSPTVAKAAKAAKMCPDCAKAGACTGTCGSSEACTPECAKACAEAEKAGKAKGCSTCAQAGKACGECAKAADAKAKAKEVKVTRSAAACKACAETGKPCDDCRRMAEKAATERRAAAAKADAARAAKVCAGCKELGKTCATCEAKKKRARAAAAERAASEKAKKDAQEEKSEKAEPKEPEKSKDDSTEKKTALPADQLVWVASSTPTSALTASSTSGCETPTVMTLRGQPQTEVQVVVEDGVRVFRAQGEPGTGLWTTPLAGLAGGGAMVCGPEGCAPREARSGCCCCCRGHGGGGEARGRAGRGGHGGGDGRGGVRRGGHGSGAGGGRGHGGDHGPMGDVLRRFDGEDMHEHIMAFVRRFADHASAEGCPLMGMIRGLHGEGGMGGEGPHVFRFEQKLDGPHARPGGSEGARVMIKRLHPEDDHGEHGHADKPKSRDKKDDGDKSKGKKHDGDKPKKEKSKKHKDDGKGDHDGEHRGHARAEQEHAWTFSTDQLGDLREGFEGILEDLDIDRELVKELEGKARRFTHELDLGDAREGIQELRSSLGRLRGKLDGARQLELEMGEPGRLELRLHKEDAPAKPKREKKSEDVQPSRWL